MLLPIVKKDKLIDFVHTRDLFHEKKNSKNFDYWGARIYWISPSERFIKINYQVNILDINYYGKHLDKKTTSNPKLKIYIGDCDDKRVLDKAIKNCTDVIHLGEIVGDPAVNINQNFSIKNNYENTIFVMSECIKRRINKFIFASSCSVYGNVKHECHQKYK